MQTLLAPRSVCPPRLFSLRARSPPRRRHKHAATITGPSDRRLDLRLVIPTPSYALCFGRCSFGAALQSPFVRLELFSTTARPPGRWRILYSSLLPFVKEKIPRRRVAFIPAIRSCSASSRIHLFAFLLGCVGTVLLPIFCQRLVDVVPSGLGMLRSAPAAGALVILGTAAGAWPFTHVGSIMFLAVACFGTATVTFSSPCRDRSRCRWWPWRSWRVGRRERLSSARPSSNSKRPTRCAAGRPAAVNALFVRNVQYLGDSSLHVAATSARPAVLIAAWGPWRV